MGNYGLEKTYGGFRIARRPSFFVWRRVHGSDIVDQEEVGASFHIELFGHEAKNFMLFVFYPEE